jgi:hypothetical protein
MLLVLLTSHIIIALSSIIFTTFMFVAPSRNKLYASYGLVGLTLATGTDLVISTHSRLVSACISGLLYLGLVSIGIVATHYRLATAKQKNR